MKQVYLLLISVTLCLALSAQQSVTKYANFDGLSRNYIVHTPTGYNNSWTDVPLVFSLHGYTSNAAQQEWFTAMNTVADTAGFILVYPNGVNAAWNSFIGGGVSTADDVGFISYLIDKMYADYHIDPARVYVCGMSNGGFMSYRLACQLGDRIAAIASVTGLMSPTLEPTCDPGRPMPVMQIHGTMDPTVPYNGGTGTGSVQQTMDFWIDYNNAPLVPVIDSIPNTDTTDNTTAIRYEYSPGDSGVQTILFKIVGGGHSWPGAFLDLGNTNYDINANVEIWRFFNQYEHPSPRAITPVSVNTIKAGDGKPVDFYPNPMGNRLYVRVLDKTVETVSLYDVLGGTVSVQKVTKPGETIQIETSQLPAGIYMLLVETTTGKLTYKLMK